MGLKVADQTKTETNRDLKGCVKNIEVLAVVGARMELIDVHR